MSPVDVIASIDFSDESWTDEELHRVCAERALPVDGDHAALIARIEADVAAKYAAATTPAASAEPVEQWTDSPTDIDAVDTHQG